MAWSNPIEPNAYHTPGTTQRLPTEPRVLSLPTVAPRAISQQTSLDPQRANDFQLALLAIAGHDLRQPLQVIQSTYEMLRMRWRGKARQELLAKGEQAVGRLTEQLDRLLGAIQLYEQTQSIELTSVALAPLFWRLLNENEDTALQRGIELRVHRTNMHVWSNQVLLGAILRNLVTNAIRYTQPGGRILIGCRRVGHEVRVDVYDTGIGIAPEQLSTIFDAFKRLDSASVRGLGIGLFVVRRALEVLSHRMEIKSIVSHGSRFSVLAPRVI